MLFEWPTTAQVFYRIMRLRRLIAVAAMLPVMVILGVSLFDPAVLSPLYASVASLAVVALVAGHVVLFPNVTLETISLSLAVTFLVVSMPVVKILSSWAPAEQQSGALVLLIGLAVAVTGVFLAVFEFVLNALAYVGPKLRVRLKTSLTLPCSAQVLQRQCALRPDTRRGRVLSGSADENGFFEVAVVSPHTADPDNADQPLVVKVDAKVLNSSPSQHDVMIVLRNGSVTVTSQTFEATKGGCRVEVSDMPGDFTFGMHALFWLTDQQADNLTEMSDVILGHEGRANGLAHGVSMLSVAGAILSPQQPVATRAK